MDIVREKVFLYKMKKLFIVLFFGAFAAAAQTKPAGKLDLTKPVMVLETSCGSCNFEMPRKECFLAVKYDGKAYAVQGTAIDDHGDAHDEKGFCNAIRKAKVQGSLKGDKFVVTYFELLKAE
ncbi:MAG: hypothetical protein RL422_423 [Bacteroidota bacterium]